MCECTHDGETPLYARDSQSCSRITSSFYLVFLFFIVVFFSRRADSAKATPRISTYYVCVHDTYTKKITCTFVQVVYMLISEYVWDEGGPVSITWSRRPLRYLPSPSFSSTTFPPYHSSRAKKDKRRKNEREKKERDEKRQEIDGRVMELLFAQFCKKEKKRRKRHVERNELEKQSIGSWFARWCSELTSHRVYSHIIARRKNAPSESVKRAFHVNSSFPVFRYSGKHGQPVLRVKQTYVLRAFSRVICID